MDIEADSSQDRPRRLVLRILECPQPETQGPVWSPVGSDRDYSFPPQYVNHITDFKFRVVYFAAFHVVRSCRHYRFVKALFCDFDHFVSPSYRALPALSDTWCRRSPSACLDRMRSHHAERLHKASV